MVENHFNLFMGRANNVTEKVWVLPESIMGHFDTINSGIKELKIVAR
jgi:hypothetical protein